MKQTLVVVGTRPEAIKLAPVAIQLGDHGRVCLTGQHTASANQVLEVFGLKPMANLSLMQAGQSLGRLTARAIKQLDLCFGDLVPRTELIVVQGDTTSAFAAALVGFYYRVPVAHIEAGLRTHNVNSPWPEEMNRRLITRLASVHFAPTFSAQRNLLAENVPADRIHMVGNTVVDAIRLMDVDRTQPDRPTVVITMHRRENHLRLGQALIAINLVAKRFPGHHFVFPVHHNPEVVKAVGRVQWESNVELICSMNYREFIRMLATASLVMTDSGGVQEEAACLGRPLLILRDETERPEVFETQPDALVGLDPDKIVDRASKVLMERDSFRASLLFGDGHASEKIVSVLEKL